MRSCCGIDELSRDTNAIAGLAHTAFEHIAHSEFTADGFHVDTISNGDRRAALVLQNKASVLREKDIMQPKDAKTPARLVYLAIMMMYLEGQASEGPYNEFALRMTEFMGAIQNPAVLGECVQLSKHVMTREYYKALMLCRKLIEYED